MKITGNKNKLIAWLCTQDEGAIYDIAPHTEKKTLNQNSYYWKLCGMVAQKMSKDGLTSAAVHNLNLRALGLREMINDEPICVYIPDTDKAEHEVLNRDTYHIAPTSQIKTGKDGTVFRCYVMLRGSHTFNVKEMTALINLMVQQAQAIGIETLTPAELERMRLMAEQQEKRKGEKNK